MTGPLAKADALLAARLAPWLALTAPKAPASGQEALPVSSAPRVDNEVLLPSRPGLQPQAGATQSQAALPGAGPQAGAGGAASLSSAARALLELVPDLHAAQAGPVRGSVALWPAAGRAPAAGALALALSQQVSESGLFYESHLAQLAVGARSLAQMQREPQAGLAANLHASHQQTEPAALAQQQQQQRLPSGMLPTAAAQAAALAMPADAPALAALMPALPLQEQVRQEGGAQAAGPELVEPGQAAESDPARAQRMPLASVEHALSRFAQAAADAQPRSCVLADSPRQAAADVAADAAPAAAAVIHPQAATLVHQQLDLLASSMFRWSGQAWPGVPMEWTVQDERARQHAHEREDELPSQWATTLSLDLPQLGSLKVNLRLAGMSVHAQVLATRSDALEQLRTREAMLTRRMSGAGLDLQGMQFDSQVQPA
ncbi:MAG: flagellar hook-length control protein FliK [Proteobacteria bacterium]|nr:flagellar hook-length control protein FliK [Pseudomonadota bacterium]